MPRRSTTTTSTKKVAALAALAAVAIGAAAADSASPDLKVEDVQAPPPSSPPTSGESKADKIAKLTPKEPWTPSSVKLPANTLADQFASRADFEAHWVPSRTQKEDVPAGSDDKDKDLWRYRGNWAVEEPEAIKGSGPGDLGLVMQSPAAHHAISRKLPAPVAFKGKDLVTVQYEVKLQNGLECGGAYLKLLSHDAKFDPAKFSDKSPYTIMFGPDKCGATNKVHFIFRHKNKRTGEVKEHHLRNPPSVPSTFSKESHLYTLLVHPELNTYEIKIDNESKQKGSLLDDFEPPVVPLKEIDDPKDSKPADWVDEAKIPDPDAKKPADWDEDAPLEIEDADAKQPDDWLADEPEYVADPDAKKPEDWDDDEDGEWTAPTVPNPKCAEVSGCGEWKRPMIKNPLYKGKWTAPLIDNPKYKGVWKPRKIANPEYVDEKHPGHMTPIGAVGLELWTMQDKILFDNIVVSDSLTPEQLAAWTKDTWVKKHDVEMALIKVEEPETVAEDADKAKQASPTDPLDWKAQFALKGLQTFASTLFTNPSKAVAQFPLVVGALGAMVAVLVTLLVGALFGGSSASVPAKPSSAAAAKAKAKKAAAEKKANGASSSSSASEAEAEEDDESEVAAKASGKKEAGTARKRQASKKEESNSQVADKDDE